MRLHILTMELSFRAECADDANKILQRTLADFASHVLAYRCHAPQLPFPDVRFDIVFAAAEPVKLRATVEAFIRIIEELDDAHRCLDTISFADEFVGDIDYETTHYERVLARLETKMGRVDFNMDNSPVVL